MYRSIHGTVLSAVLFSAGATAVDLSAQTLTACRVPDVGAIYMIGVAGAPTTCLDPAHIEFSWTEGAEPADGSVTEVKLADGAVTTDKLADGGVTAAKLDPSIALGGDHGGLTGLADDDHPQYLPVDGVRNGTASGNSIALGHLTVSSGFASLATGNETQATRASSTAMGFKTQATGSISTAMGTQTVASGQFSVAMGALTTASGDRSTAMGSSASTNLRTGAFVYGDHSTGADLLAPANNSFSVRAAGGVFLHTDANLSTGCSLSAGSGTWACTSDREAKKNFRAENGEAVLEAISSMAIESWNYRAEDSSIRHIGPTAQDFRAAFALGTDDKTIGAVDADGINMLAIQALEKRTTDLGAGNDALRAENEELRNRLAAIEATLLSLMESRR